MCQGAVNFNSVQANTYVTSTCCNGIGKSASRLDLCSSTLNLAGVYGYTYLASNQFQQVVGSSSTAIAGSGITIDNKELGSIEMHDYYATFTDTKGANKGEISGGYVTLSFTTSTTSKTQIIPGGVLYTDGGSGSLDTPGDYPSLLSTEFIGPPAPAKYTEISKDRIHCYTQTNEILLADGTLTLANTSLPYGRSTINKSHIESYAYDKTYSSLDGATFNQWIPDYETLKTYIYPGTIESTGASAKFAVDDGAISLSTTSTGTTIKLAPNDLPANTYIYFQQIDVCVDGKTKKAWVLMSDPVDDTATTTPAA